jgi:hypothetical protein
MAHGRYAPQFRHHLRHHRAEVRLLALQLTERIADVDALDLRCIERAGVEGAERGVADDVGDVLSVAGPDLGEVGLVAAEDICGLAHVNGSVGGSQQASPIGLDVPCVGPARMRAAADAMG